MFRKSIFSVVAAGVLICCLPAMGASQTLDSLIRQLQSGRLPEKEAAAWKIGDLGKSSSSAVPALISALKDDNEIVRRGAPKSLGQIGDRQAVPAWLGAAGVGFNASWALKNGGLSFTPSEVQSLSKILRESKDPYIQMNLAAQEVERSQGNSVSAPSELLSANALYREFQNNPVDASAKYVDQAVVLHGRRGKMVLMSDGVSAAVHIADGDRPNALVLSFPDRKQLKGLDRDAVFRFKCTVTKYEFGSVWMNDCSIEAGPGAAASKQIAERPTVVGGLLSANALYRAFESNADDASAKYVGQTMTLEGLRGDVIRMSDGVSAAVHISDRFKSDALILSFPDRTQLAGIENGARFRFRCTIKKFEYLIVWMDNCSIVSR